MSWVRTQASGTGVRALGLHGLLALPAAIRLSQDSCAPVLLWETTEPSLSNVQPLAPQAPFLTLSLSPLAGGGHGREARAPLRYPPSGVKEAWCPRPQRAG